MKLLGLGDQFVYLLGTGLVGMGIMDFMDEEEGESADVDGEDDDLFGDGMGGEMDDDFGGMDDDFGGMDAGMEMDDGMGDEMNDWADGGGDDEFGMGGGGGGGATQELENRIDELENEVAEISSTVGTVRSENEQISAKVDDTEENVRKLLEIYEMVTRGVNPFVDEAQGGMGGGGFDGGGGEGSFGLFDGDEDEEEESELDDDVADAEAESFFEDDFDEEDDEEFDDGFEEDAADDLGFDDPDEGMGDDALDGDGMDMDGDIDDGMEMDDGDGGQAGGSTFAELKEEYESGDADWANGEEAAAEADAETEPESEPAPEPTVEDATDDGGFEFEEPADSADPAETEPVATETRQSGLDSKPYLAELPSGYVADLVVMEWLEFLVTEFGPDDAVRTITYYGDIGWVSESVEEELLAYVGGFADVEEVDPDETGPATLAIDDHIRSLTFLSQLTGDAVQRKIVEHCAQIRGGSDGIQR